MCPTFNHFFNQSPTKEGTFGWDLEGTTFGWDLEGTTFDWDLRGTNFINSRSQ